MSKSFQFSFFTIMSRGKVGPLSGHNSKRKYFQCRTAFLLLVLRNAAPFYFIHFYVVKRMLCFINCIFSLLIYLLLSHFCIVEVLILADCFQEANILYFRTCIQHILRIVCKKGLLLKIFLINILGP